MAENKRIRVIYATKTGHSRKLGRDIAAALGVVAERARPGLRLTEPVDILFLVGGIYSGHSSPELTALAGSLDSALAGRVLLVTSCATGTTRQEEVRSALEKGGVRAEDEFLCEGGFLFVNFGHPNRADRAKAAAWAREKVEKISAR